MVPVEPVEIAAGRLHLRPWTGGDVDAVLRAGTDPAVQRWTQVPAPYTRAHAEDFASRYVPQSWADDGELAWAVCDATSEAPLASVGLHATHQRGMREVGFWCLPEARGQGVVPDALHAVSRWAFVELGLTRLEWAAEVGNAAALPDPGVLTAGDLRLRPWRAADADALAAVCAGEQDALPAPPEAMSDQQHARWWVAEHAPQAWASGDGTPLAVLHQDGSVAGSVQLHRRRKRDGVAEAGVWVAPADRSRGVATATFEALLDWAVPALRLGRVEWLSYPDNAASLALPRWRWPLGSASAARGWPSARSPASARTSRVPTPSSWPAPGDRRPR